MLSLTETCMLTNATGFTISMRYVHALSARAHNKCGRLKSPTSSGIIQLSIRDNRNDSLIHLKKYDGAFNGWSSQ